MNINDLAKRLKIEVLPVYFLKGQDAYLVDYAIKLLSNLTDADFAEFNFTVYEDAENMKDIITSLNTIPVFADKRIVVLKSSQNLDAGDKSRLEAYLKQPADFSILVMVDDLVPPDMQYKKESPLHNLYKYGDVVLCGDISYGQFQAWIDQYAKQNGAEISPQAISLLSKYTSNNMMRALTELKKLISFSQGRVIDQKIVDEMVTPDNEYKTFALSNALAKKNNDEALNILNSLVERGESPSALLSLIISQYHKMLEAKISNLDIKDLAKSMGTSVPSMSIAKDLAKPYTQMELKNIVDKLHGLEYAFKSGKTSELAVLYEAFAILLQKR